MFTWASRAVVLMITSGHDVGASLNQSTTGPYWTLVAQLLRRAQPEIVMSFSPSCHGAGRP
jgi:hypothetical protein